MILTPSPTNQPTLSDPVFSASPTFKCSRGSASNESSACSPWWTTTFEEAKPKSLTSCNIFLPHHRLARFKTNKPSNANKKKSSPNHKTRRNYVPKNVLFVSTKNYVTQKKKMPKIATNVNENGTAAGKQWKAPKDAQTKLIELKP